MNVAGIINFIAHWDISAVNLVASARGFQLTTASPFNKVMEQINLNTHTVNVFQ